VIFIPSMGLDTFILPVENSSITTDILLSASTSTTKSSSGGIVLEIDDPLASAVAGDVELESGSYLGGLIPLLLDEPGGLLFEVLR